MHTLVIELSHYNCIDMLIENYKYLQLAFYASTVQAKVLILVLIIFCPFFVFRFFKVSVLIGTQ